MVMHKKIFLFLKEKGSPCTQKEISKAVPKVNRAVLLGYLRCLVDLGEIKSKAVGKAKVYFL